MGFIEEIRGLRTDSPEYQEAVLNHFNDIRFEMATLLFEEDGKEIEIKVMTDSLKIDGVRINATAAFQEEIAKRLGLYSMTQKVADKVWDLANQKLHPRTFSETEDDLAIMDTTEVMLKHSKAVDDEIGTNLNRPGWIVADPGKYWIPFPNNSGIANYGWHKPSGGIIQNPYDHGWFHSDYSQIIRLVSPEVLINGVSHDFNEVVTGHDYRALSYQRISRLADTERPESSKPKPIERGQDSDSGLFTGILLTGLFLGAGYSLYKGLSS